MTREEFAALPLKVALGVIFDALKASIERLQAPKVPLPPKYDARLYKKDGFVWMSEMTLADLKWWHGRKSESANSGSQWAEKDAKTSATLARWIEWRESYPTEVWSGTRGDDRVTGAPPSRDPQLHQGSPRGGSGPSQHDRQKADGFAPDADDGYSGGGGGGDELPFD